MRNRVMIVLVLALVSGGVAAYLAYTFLRDPGVPRDAQGAETAAVGVVVAARALPAGHMVEAQDVRVAEWPVRALPEGYSGAPEEVVGRGLLTPVSTNEPLLADKLARKEAGGGLPIVIPEGMRAMSVAVDQVVGVAGFALPGTRVDVLVTVDQMAQQEEPATQIVLQNIQVLTAGQITERDARGEPREVPVVTLLVEPEQAERLALASTKGRIQLALRNTLDMDTVATPGIRARQLLINRQVVAAPLRRTGPVRPSGVSVEVYKGTERQTETVRNSPPPEGGGGGS